MRARTAPRPAAAELVRDLDALTELEPEWSALALSRENVFVTPEWFRAWHRHYGRRSTPFIGVVRGADGHLEGVLPLVLERRTLRFAGSAFGDRFGPAAAPDREVDVAIAVGEALREVRGTWSSLLLENVAADAEWWRELSRASGCGGRPIIGRHSELPGIRFDGQGWDEYLASRSRNLRSQIRRRRRGLEGSHEVNVRWTGDAGEVGPHMELLFHLHHARWDTRAQASSLASDRVLAFQLDFARIAAERGWLRLAFLEVDREAVAGWYGWRVGDRYAYYQAGFDPRWADRSVGFVLFSETIRAAIEEGATRYDMLLGGEHFKQRFADYTEAAYTVLIAAWWRPARAVAAAEAAATRASHRLPVGSRERLKRGARVALRRLPMARRR